MKIAYRTTILTNWPFIARRIRRGIRTGEFLWDAFYFLKFLTMPETNQAIPAHYYAQDRWPRWDFSRNAPRISPTPKVVVRTEPVRAAEALWVAS